MMGGDEEKRERFERIGTGGNERGERGMKRGKRDGKNSGRKKRAREG